MTKPDEKRVVGLLRDLLEELTGEPMLDGDFEETPERVARWLLERFRPGVTPEGKYFPAPDTKDLIILQGIPFNCLCPHHLLPYFGTIHLAYLPDERIVGLSKLVRWARHRSLYPKTQERLTWEVADYLYNEMEPQGVLATIRATHLCMAFRGVETHGTETITTAIRGSIDKEEVLRTIDLHKGANQ